MPRSDRDNSGPRRRPSGPWRNGPVPVVGLTGAIGAGKSLAASILAGKGAFLLDADKVGHVLMEQSPCRDRVLERFGEAVLGPMPEVQGTRRPIDRRALGSIVFANDAALRDLEFILHPAMRNTFVKAIGRETRKARHPAVVLDAAILFEADWNSLCDRVLFVDAPAEARLARLESARGWTLETLAAREKAQAPLEEKRKLADFVVHNHSTPEALKSAIDALWPDLVRPPRRHHPALPSTGARGQPPP